jgi:hypothetical protein
VEWRIGSGEIGLPLNNEDRALLQEFGALFRSCAVCWWPESDGRRRLEIHHLQQGAGRKHDRRNLLSLCANCHSVFHSGPKVTGLPDINKGTLLTAKQESDSEYYDPEYLASLRHKKHLGYEPTPIPDFYLQERQRNLWPSRRP